MQDATRHSLTESYNLSAGFAARQDSRGMMNETWFVGDKGVLTIFKNRTPAQVSLIADIVLQDQSGLMPEIIKAKAGPVSLIGGSPAILWKRFDGNHFVRRDHSDKMAIPETGHASIADAFWKLHASLNQYPDVGEQLGRVNYLPSPESGEPVIAYSELPGFLQTGLIGDYLKGDALPLKYPALVHHDMERQNFLHDDTGKVTGIVDADSFKKGDLLFEYTRCMMNFMFSDPEYKPEYADHYMRALAKSGMVDPEDISLIPKLVRAFIAKDLLDYCRYDHPPKTNLSRLTAIYDNCLKHVDSYFETFSLSAVMRSGDQPSITPSAPLIKQGGPK